MLPLPALPAGTAFTGRPPGENRGSIIGWLEHCIRTESSTFTQIDYFTPPLCSLLLLHYAVQAART